MSSETLDFVVGRMNERWDDMSEDEQDETIGRMNDTINHEINKIFGEEE